MNPLPYASLKLQALAFLLTLGGTILFLDFLLSQLPPDPKSKENPKYER